MRDISNTESGKKQLVDYGRTTQAPSDVPLLVCLVVDSARSTVLKIINKTMITIANNEHTEGIVVGEFVLSVVDAQVTVQGKEILYSSLRGQRDLPAGWCSPNAVRVHNPQKQNLISFLQTKSQNLNIVL